MSACPICARGEPLGVLARRPTTWITTEPDPRAPGYLCVVSRRHVVEPYELPPAERAAFWDDIPFAAERIATLLEPEKLHDEKRMVLPSTSCTGLERLREALR
jgi:diadenosine tetraphosphate (Ap4A) HIT family hydrolase